MKRKKKKKSWAISNYPSTWALLLVWKATFRVILRLALPASDTWQNVKIRVMTRQVATILRPTKPWQGLQIRVLTNPRTQVEYPRGHPCKKRKSFWFWAKQHYHFFSISFNLWLRFCIPLSHPYTVLVSWVKVFWNLRSHFLLVFQLVLQ